MTRRLLSVFFYFIPITIWGQSPSFSFRTIGINQGLSQSCVIDIAFDSLGFAWFATQDGLNRYDGKDFLVFPKNFDDITTHTGSRLGKLVLGKAGTLWLLTSGGHLEKMGLHDHRFTDAATTLITCVYEDTCHDQWLGTADRGIIFRPANPSTPAPAITLPSPSVSQITQDKEGRYWILTNNGLVVFNPATHTQKTFLPGVPCSWLSQDNKGSYWLGTYGKGIYKLSNKDTIFHPFASLPSDLIIQAVTVDRNDRVWVGTYGNGLFLIEEERINHFLADKSDPFSLPYNDILCIREDPYGGIWIGTDGGGVAQYNARFSNFSLLSRENVPGNMPIEQVRAITTGPQKGIWIGTSNKGLSYVDRSTGKFTALSLSPYRKGISNYERIVSLFTDREGDCWVGTQGNGLLIMDGKTKAVKKHFHPDANRLIRLPDHTIWCMLPDTGSRVWVGTRNGGLCLVDKYAGPLRIFDNTTLPENNIRSLVRIDDSIICIGFENKGIRFFNYHTGALLPETSLAPVLQRPFNLKCLFYQHPKLWIGTLGNGIFIYDLHTNILTSISEKEGLPNNTVYGILPDHYGSFWMSTNKGLCCFHPPASLDHTDKTHFTVFTHEDGLQSNEFNTGAYHEGRDGELFFGGVNGLTMFHPTRLTVDGQQPGIVLTGIMVNNSPLQEDTVAAYRKMLDLSYWQNSLSFNFAALDFVASNKIAYFYRLQPYESQWIEAGHRNYTAYTNLDPGNYTFQIKAVSPFSRGDARITTMEIRVRPPFWQTWWFIALCILSLAGLLYAFYRYRISQLMKVQQIRHRIATDLHDDIGSALTNISLLSELSRKSLTKGNDAGTFLDRISEEVQSSGQALDDIVWSINTNNDTLEQMVARMRRYAAEIFDGADIRYEFDMSIPSTQRRLNMEQRRDCFLAFKEILNNIYKHARALNVRIRLTMEGSSFRIEVSDDGKGFDTRAVTQRNGLKNIRLRVDKWRGAARIESSASGTRVAVEFPLA
ncbi:MAG: ATP-binding protein [Chitinophagaceae bacterium]|nr:ATP-binding protein [Chitinophagaceae bacterium]